MNPSSGKGVTPRSARTPGQTPSSTGASASRLNVGQTNMYSASASGMNTSRRERKGFGRTPHFFIIHAQRSCSATTWQPQPQKNRPKTSVLRIATAKKIAPAFTCPSSRVFIDSLGSTGETVLPLASHWEMCAAKRRWTTPRTIARRGPFLDLRTLGGEVRSAGSTVNGIETPRSPLEGRSGSQFDIRRRVLGLVATYDQSVQS